MIFDMKMIESTMKEIGYDAKKMPLGKLTDQTVKEGFGVLTEILKAVKDKKNREILNNLSSKQKI
jgi:poly [ADP-ribose] polymerase 2/3/4